MHWSKRHRTTCRWSFSLFNLDAPAGSPLNSMEEQVSQICAATLVFFSTIPTCNSRCTLILMSLDSICQERILCEDRLPTSQNRDQCQNAHSEIQYFVCSMKRKNFYCLQTTLASALYASPVFFSCVSCKKTWPYWLIVDWQVLSMNSLGYIYWHNCLYWHTPFVWANVHHCYDKAASNSKRYFCYTQSAGIFPAI
jgi:hypothetical protein